MRLVIPKKKIIIESELLVRKGAILSMASIAQSLAALTAAGALLVSGSLNAAAPQNDESGLLFLINRQWRISQNYTPELREAKVTGQLKQMRPDASYALEEMFAACKEEQGVTLKTVSGYRSYAKQSRLYANKLQSVRGNEAKADEYVARPGASEHHLGLAMDVGQKQDQVNLTAAFGSTVGGKWTRENCWRFGFILRYEEEWEDVTGYKFEPWHVRYIGKEHAQAIHDDPKPLEEYLIELRGELLLSILSEE